MNTAKRRAYQEKADAELRAWSARVDELRARAAAHKAAGKIEFYERLEKLSEQRDSLRERLGELRESSGDAWEEVRHGFEGAVEELSTALRSAIDQFSKETGNEAQTVPSPSGEARDRGLAGRR
jgi:response regulator RpfG family c-di-GMP phosphodiesterase